MRAWLSERASWRPVVSNQATCEFDFDNFSSKAPDEVPASLDELRLGQFTASLDESLLGQIGNVCRADDGDSSEYEYLRVEIGNGVNFYPSPYELNDGPGSDEPLPDCLLVEPRHKDIAASKR